MPLADDQASSYFWSFRAIEIVTFLATLALIYLLSLGWIAKPQHKRLLLGSTICSFVTQIWYFLSVNVWPMYPYPNQTSSVMQLLAFTFENITFMVALNCEMHLMMCLESITHVKPIVFQRLRIALFILFLTSAMPFTVSIYLGNMADSGLMPPLQTPQVLILMKLVGVPFALFCISYDVWQATYTFYILTKYQATQNMKKHAEKSRSALFHIRIVSCIMIFLDLVSFFLTLLPIMADTPENNFLLNHVGLLLHSHLFLTAYCFKMISFVIFPGQRKLGNLSFRRNTKNSAEKPAEIPIDEAPKPSLMTEVITETQRM
ncbi:hypothetical protein EDD86DRAFT_246113 [Gorgonomyces haynaldii]|nr:hypothetical protein EDD86DRAFT_246113 [Gorgonomyces haynaldii]